MSGDQGLAPTAKLDTMARPRPVLFLHIPKTAGTSFLLMLQNAFSDNRVLRIHQVDRHIQEMIDGIVETKLDEIACLIGHLPIHLFESCLDRFQPFTVLRNPVDRVLSLFRFFKRHNQAELQRWGFLRAFTLEEFLSSRAPGIYGQVNNGMVRMLCGDRRLWDPKDQKFWSQDGDLDVMLRALANLEQLDFGLTEQMPQTLRLAQARWSIPYTLDEYRENATVPDSAGWNIAALHHIVALNTMDLTLYERARALFRQRLQALPPAAACAGANPLAVFAPPLNQQVSVGDIPGRQGFHEFEPNGVAWLQADRTAGISFIGRDRPMRLRLHVCSVMDDYPFADLVVRVNQQAVNCRISPMNRRWVWLESDYFEARKGLNQISIEAPLSVLVTALDSQSLDNRRLGVALSHIALETQFGASGRK